MAIEIQSETDLASKIRKFMADNFVFSELQIGDDDSFLDNGIIDSTGILELILYVEENFGLEVRDHEVVPENFDSVHKLACYIQSKQTT